ncbi:hypothetical protein [Streptomyces sp. NPDC048196]|uniref:chitobiase/beta-hexosaminidase C-terminal domain-containing protein n=1 Tax=Streptomyces sp. NPDC048196 TaxID=3154712 RepID=UPI0033D13ECD
MATHTVASGEVGAHALTLTANTIETVAFEGGLGTVTVLSHDGASPVYFTTDGTTPTVAGSHCWCVPAAIGAVTVPVSTYGPNSIKAISAGTPTISVQRGT